MAAVLMALQLGSLAAQTTHVVGGNLGWTVPPNGAATYSTWAATQTFAVGDVLLFNFTTGVHDVTTVTQSAFGPCTITNPISQVTTGPAGITLTTPGMHYYICTVGPHCSLGQKLAINVGGGSATPAPAPTPKIITPPVQPPKTAPAPAPTTSNSPTPSPETAPAPAPKTSTPQPSPTPAPHAVPVPSPSSPAPSSSATPPPMSTTPPPPTGIATTPPAPTPTGSTTAPPPPNAASSFTASALPAAALSIAIALFY